MCRRALRQRETVPAGDGIKAICDRQTRSHAAAVAPDRLPSSGTVVLDVEQGGIVVPSFVGKSVRAAIELAEESGLDLDAVGSGTGAGAVSGAGIACCDGIASDGEIWTLKRCT